jgi:hypothetical protein
MLRYRLTAIPVAVLAASALIAACGGSNDKQLEHGKLSVNDAVAAVHVPCLDHNQDFVLAPDDVAQPLQGGGESEGDDVDLNADGTVDDADAAFLDVDMRVVSNFDFAACGDAPIEYLVSSDDEPAISCDDGAKALIVAAIGGGVVDLRDNSNAAGVRWMTNALLDQLHDRDYQTVTMVSGPGISGLEAELNPAMETWMTHSLRTMLDQYPCARAVLLGHSHGAITAEVVASRLEAAYGDRIAVVAAIDRVEDLYVGDTQSLPQSVPVFNVFETNDADTAGGAHDAPNFENWDASGETAPKEGEGGGPSEPVTHTTIDNSPGVRDRVIAEVLDRLGE